MSNYDKLLTELQQAWAEQIRAKTKIATSVKNVVGLRQFLKATSPLAEIEHQLNTCGRAMAGIRLDKQRAGCGSLMMKALASQKDGKISAAEVATINAKVLHLDGQFSEMQKSLEQFDAVCANIKAVRAQGKELAAQAAAVTKTRLSSILASIDSMHSNLDLSADEANRLRAFAEGAKS